MPIVSLSLTPELLQELDALQRRLGFSSRSELVRAGIRSLLEETRDLEGLEGRDKTLAILSLVHDPTGEAEVSELKHKYEDIITTQIHNGFGGECVELFLLHGEARRIRGMMVDAKRRKRIRYSKLVRP